MNAHQETSFMLGEVKVSPSHNTLWTPTKSLKLQPKAMAVLHYLAYNQNRVISNEELIERLWEGRVVTHGSVQKSINALRSAFNELIGDQELIAHYSKRGYQLMIAPQFLAHPLPDEVNASAVANRQAANINPLRLWRTAILTAVILAAVGIIFNTLEWSTLYLPSDHKTVFQSTRGYTNETGHEQSATPHPDNQHIAYIREKRTTNKQNAARSAIESDIIIRNAAGKDWRVANSGGRWFKLAWSPTGNNLVAIEIKHRDGLPIGGQFYQAPNYLYSFHIFTLDLAHEQLLEKQQLSQWQGHIFSVTWWDESTLEIVAKQGPNSGNGRYHYSLANQQLTLLDEYEGAVNPVASAVLNQKTALASLHKNKIQIDFLDAKQQRINRTQLDVTSVDISWIPDGSGILAYAEAERKLIAVYLNGKQVTIPLTDSKDKIFSRPHYSADGNGIFYTEEKRSSNILLAGLDGTKKQLTENTDFNYAASSSPNGDKIVYASVRNNQIQLWLVENGQERQLTQQPIPKKVDAIVWSDDGEHIVFNADNQVFHHNLLTDETTLLVNGETKIEPIAYFPATHQLVALQHNGDIRNLWRFEGEHHKQLTFGAVGSAIEFNGDIYFQYVSEHGLWALRHKDDSLARITSSLTEYSKLLKADQQGIYFMTGGVCQESDIYYQNFATADQSVFIKQENHAVSTTSFNTNKGLLQTECYLPEANIVLLQ
ncbi:winged helix-turn-helix domain-containing protein [Cellvibrio sp. pealriver]|uniref:winged helix-turn-helix domain-containing protein n=1 Tax=Cellvibrio sp. pealriver TaxID=1622269 RepID=UPI00066FD5E9|nr:winged helix-turn-helix domain-containing protein [Cellvibrio sp. pealriver]